jgi:hypothetical protein
MFRVTLIGSITRGWDNIIQFLASASKQIEGVQPHERNSNPVSHGPAISSSTSNRSVPELAFIKQLCPSCKAMVSLHGIFSKITLHSRLQVGGGWRMPSIAGR